MERIELLMRGGGGDDNIEDDGGSHTSDAVEIEEEPFSEIGEDGQGLGEGDGEGEGELEGEDDRRSRRHFDHSGQGNSLDLDGEEEDDEEDNEDEEERDRGREEGVLLDYDDEQMMQSPPLHGSDSISMARSSDSWRTAGSGRQGQGQTSYSTPDRVSNPNS